MIDQALAETDQAKRDAIWGHDRQAGHGGGRASCRASTPRACSSRPKRLTNVFVNEAFGMYDYLRSASRRPVMPRHLHTARQVKAAGGRSGATRAGHRAGHCGHVHHQASHRRRRAALRRQHRHLRDLLPGAAAGRGDAGDARHPVRRPGRHRRRRSRSPPSGWASTTRSGCSTADWVKGIFVGAEYDYGAGVEHCPAPCFGYSFITRQPVWPDLLDRLPVTLSLALGAADHLAARRRRHRRALRAAPRHFFDRAAMGIALAGVSLPIFFTGLVSLVSSATRSARPRPGGSLHAVHREPGRVGLRPDPALDHPGLPVRRRRTPGSPGPACWRR